MEKQEAIMMFIPEKQYTGKAIRQTIQAIHVKMKADALKVGDVFGMEVGKRRPCVIFAIKKDVVYAIPLSTTKDRLNIHPYKSRFFGVGYYSRNFVIAGVQYAKDNFQGILDDPKGLTKAVTKLQNLLINL